MHILGRRIEKQTNIHFYLCVEHLCVLSEGEPDLLWKIFDIFSFDNVRQTFQKWFPSRKIGKREDICKHDKQYFVLLTQICCHLSFSLFP